MYSPRYSTRDYEAHVKRFGNKFSTTNYRQGFTPDTSIPHWVGLREGYVSMYNMETEEDVGVFSPLYESTMQRHMYVYEKGGKKKEKMENQDMYRCITCNRDISDKQVKWMISNLKQHVLSPFRSNISYDVATSRRSYTSTERSRSYWHEI